MVLVELVNETAYYIPIKKKQYEQMDVIDGEVGLRRQCHGEDRSSRNYPSRLLSGQE